MMNPRTLHTISLPRRLVIIFCVWIFVWGMAAVDLLDLTDEFLQPPADLGQVIEPELDELDEGIALAVAALFTRPAACPEPLTGVVASTLSASVQSTRSLYQQLGQYRI
jgi:hypothetical protein